MGTPRIASPEVDRFLRTYWDRHTISELAKMVGWTDRQVRERARTMNLPGRREIALAITRKLDADRIARRRAVKPLPAVAQSTEAGWPDGWSIKPPTLDQLRARR